MGEIQPSNPVAQHQHLQTRNPGLHQIFQIFLPVKLYPVLYHPGEVQELQQSRMHVIERKLIDLMKHQMGAFSESTYRRMVLLIGWVHYQKARAAQVAGKAEGSHGVITPSDQKRRASTLSSLGLTTMQIVPATHSFDSLKCRWQLVQSHSASLTKS